MKTEWTKMRYEGKKVYVIGFDKELMEFIQSRIPYETLTKGIPVFNAMLCRKHSLVRIVVGNDEDGEFQIGLMIRISNFIPITVSSKINSLKTKFKRLFGIEKVNGC